MEGIDLRTLTGTLHSVLVNRLSYLLDLRGPSLAVDSACSSSLVALHLGCQSLRFGESDIAIVGGVSLIIAPELMVAMSKVGFMSPDGRCKTFDARADGFGRGEGCGILVLKRLSDAIADCDRILAVVRGSAVNQDGHSTLLAAPNGRAQEMLIREALANAQLEPWRVGYVETHGTGTALGDPIEVEAIAATIGKPHPNGGRCHLGAVKANIGHLEAAAGVVGVIKAALALRHGEIPPQPQFSKLSPHISLADTRLEIASSFVEWPAGTVPRCAAVSSFGVGGTNAHVLLEEAPVIAPASASEAVDQPNILLISARSPAALQQLAEQWGTFLSRSDAALVDICYTAANRRSHYGHRRAVVGKSREELMGRLRDAAPIPAVTEPRVAFVFSGQGPQWYGMGRELLAQESVYRDVISECDTLLRPLSGWSLLDELARPEQESRLDQTEIAQPALFALQAGLAALWKSWGLEPDAVIGHSVGEIAALRVAGALELAEAIRVVWHRARIMQQATGDGRMASVSLSVSEAADVLRPFGDRLSIAAVNGPRSVVLSGEAAALQDILAKLSERGIAHRMLPMPYAFHSAQMAPFQHQLLEALAPVRATPAAITVYSTVTGEQTLGIPFDAAYFGRNMREPVRFANAVRAAIADGCNAFVEIAPHPVLSGLIAESASPERVAAIVASLRRGRPERETMLSACATLHMLGLDLAWKTIQPVGQVVELPSYPWQRKRHWIRSTARTPFLCTGVRAPAAWSSRLRRGKCGRAFRGRFERGPRLAGRSPRFRKAFTPGRGHHGNDDFRCRKVRIEGGAAVWIRDRSSLYDSGRGRRIGVLADDRPSRCFRSNGTRIE